MYMYMCIYIYYINNTHANPETENICFCGIDINWSQCLLPCFTKAIQVRTWNQLDYEYVLLLIQAGSVVSIA